MTLKVNDTTHRTVHVTKHGEKFSFRVEIRILAHKQRGKEEQIYARAICPIKHCHLGYRDSKLGQRNPASASRAAADTIESHLKGSHLIEDLRAGKVT